MEMKVDRSKARLLRMSESDDSGYVEGTPSERMEMVWALTCQVLALSGYDVDAPLRRDIAKLIRPGQATDETGQSGSGFLITDVSCQGRKS